MKATLIVIQNDADHAEAKALVARLMRSNAESDRVRGLAQARSSRPMRRPGGRAGARAA